MVKPLDIVGQTFGRLTAIGRAYSLHGNVYWRFRCVCGNEPIVAAFKAKNGHTQSCGCLHREITRERATVHGDSNAGGRQRETRLYRVWSAMRRRCTNPNENRWEYYGGRGISVCPEWSDFTTFKAWAAQTGYRDDLSIDRIDNDGDYTPTNCRWATPKEQAANRGGKFAQT